MELYLKIKDKVPFIERQTDYIPKINNAAEFRNSINRFLDEARVCIHRCEKDQREPTFALLAEGYGLNGEIDKAIDVANRIKSYEKLENVYHIGGDRNSEKAMYGVARVNKIRIDAIQSVCKAFLKQNRFDSAIEWALKEPHSYERSEELNRSLTLVVKILAEKGHVDKALEAVKEALKRKYRPQQYYHDYHRPIVEELIKKGELERVFFLYVRKAPPLLIKGNCAILAWPIGDEVTFRRESKCSVKYH